MEKNTNYTEIKFQWYDKGIFNNHPKGDITLGRFVDSVVCPKPSLIKAFDSIRIASEKGDLKLKDKLKQDNLFFVTPSIRVNNTRCYDDIYCFLPFCVLEYDKIPYAEELRDYIFNTYDSCIFAFTSPSKSGCKFLFHIPIATSIEGYKEYYFGIASELNKFKGLDMANQNCSLPLFCSYDENALFREDAKVSTLRGYKEDAFKPFEGETEEVEDITDKERQFVERLIRKQVRKADEDGVGHINVRTAGLICGGYSASGYIDEDYGLEIIIEEIEASDYLTKNIRGYSKTARDMIERGKQSPLVVDKEYIKND